MCLVLTSNVLDAIKSLNMCGLDLSSLFIAVISSNVLFHFLFLSLKLKSAVKYKHLYVYIWHLTMPHRAWDLKSSYFAGSRAYEFCDGILQNSCVREEENTMRRSMTGKKYTFFWRLIQKITVFPTCSLVFFSKSIK